MQNGNIILKMATSLLNNGEKDFNIAIENNVAMAHTNFNIIDLLSYAQPLCLQNNNNKYLIVFNGKLFNSDKLKKELNLSNQNGKPPCDAEIVLQSYIALKEKCLLKLDGHFSFAIYSASDSTLFLARDRLGIKPLYYTISNNTFIFATKIKSILAHPSVKARVSEREIMELIALGPAHTPGNTYFKNIHELKAGHYATYSGINFNTYCYWDLKQDTFEDDIYTAISKTKSLVTDSLKKQLVSEVPVCSMLSGGLDSSILTTLAKEDIPNLSTFSIDFSGNNVSFKSNDYQPTQDSEYVKIMSEFLKTNHNTIYFKDSDLFYSLKDAMIARDMPSMADIDASMYVFLRAISKSGFKVCLSGECSDEIFAGYPWYYKEKLQNAPSFPWALSDDIRAKLLRPNTCSYYDIKEYILESYNNTIKNLPDFSSNELESKFKKINYLTIKWFMNTLIERTERASVASGIDVRLPFADYKIFEYIYNVPARYKLGLIHNSQPIEKYVLRKAFENELPREVVFRKKSPFPKTYSNDYLNLVLPEIKNIISNPDSPLSHIVNTDYLTQIISTEGKILEENWFGQLMTYPQMLAFLLQVNMWFDEYNIDIEI